MPRPVATICTVALLRRCVAGRSTQEEIHGRTPTAFGTVTRRQVLKGGRRRRGPWRRLCASSPPARRRARRRRPRRRPPAASRPQRSGERTRRGGSRVHAPQRQRHARVELFGPRPEEGHAGRIVDAFTAKTGITVKINTVDHGTFQDQISAYLQGTPDDVFTWFSGFRMRFFAAQGLATDISDVWAKVGGNYSDAFKVGSTGDDGKQYFIPIYNYPWAVFYRKSVFADKGYTIPTTLDEFKTLATR